MDKPNSSFSTKSYPKYAPFPPDTPQGRRGGPRRPSLIARFVGWLSHLFRFLLATALFFVLMVLASYWVVGKYIHGAEVKAPDLTNMTLLDAMKNIKKDNLSLKFDRDQPHETIPMGSIIGQYPMAGDRIKKGTPIRVVVSDGSLLIPVPDLRGEAKIKARTTLRNLGLNVGNIAVIPSTGSSSGVVLATDPPGGSRVAPGAAVNIVVSGGQTQAVQTMPNLQGLTLEKARDELLRYSLFIAEERPSSDSGQPGQVLTQKPAPGEPLTETTRIVVTYVPRSEEDSAAGAAAPKSDNYETSQSDLVERERPASPPAEASRPAGASANPGAASPSQLPAVKLDEALSSHTQSTERPAAGAADEPQAESAKPEPADDEAATPAAGGNESGADKENTNALQGKE